MESNKYQTSKHGFQCLGPCYDKGTITIHPVTLEQFTDFTGPFCPVHDWEYKNLVTGEVEHLIHDTCKKPDNKIKEDQNTSIITPKIDFNCSNFLKMNYNINSMEDMLEWIEHNDHLPYYTVKRVIDCSWRAYGLSNYILDDRLVIHYIRIAKQKWLPDIYNTVGKYITVKNSKIYLTDKETSLDKNRIERMNFIIEKFINISIMSKFLSKFIEYYSSEDNKDSSIVSYTDELYDSFVRYIESKINITQKE